MADESDPERAITVATMKIEGALAPSVVGTNKATGAYLHTMDESDIQRSNETALPERRVPCVPSSRVRPKADTVTNTDPVRGRLTLVMDPLLTC